MANAIPTDTLCADPPPLADELENAYKAVFHGTVFDAENRLVSAQTSTNLPASVPRKKVEFTYDYMSRRVGKSAYAWSTNSESWLLTSDSSFLYDGWNLLSELSTVNGSLFTNSFVHGLDLSGTLSGAGGIGGLLSARYGTNDVIFSYDGNGNVSELTFTNGAIAAHYEYSPFGETVVATGPLARENLFRFSTKPVDDVTGLSLYEYRPYQPPLARWLSRDPMEEEGGINLYVYVMNQVPNTIDSLGLYAGKGMASQIALIWAWGYYQIVPNYMAIGSGRLLTLNDSNDIWSELTQVHGQINEWIMEVWGEFSQDKFTHKPDSVLINEPIVGKPGTTLTGFAIGWMDINGSTVCDFDQCEMTVTLTDRVDLNIDPNPSGSMELDRNTAVTIGYYDPSAQWWFARFMKPMGFWAFPLQVNIKKNFSRCE